jgi:hypothetical protein
MGDLEEEQRTSQLTHWVISLAISIICCACLFVALAFYITDQHITLSTVSLRMDLLQQRQDRMTAEMEFVRRTLRGDAIRSQAQQPSAEAPVSSGGVEVKDGSADVKPEEPKSDKVVPPKAVPPSGVVQ